MVLAGRIQAVDRFVKDEELGHDQQRGGESQALAHAERKALDPVIGDVGESDFRENLIDTRRARVAAAQNGKRGKVPTGSERWVEARAVYKSRNSVRRGQRASDWRAEDL
jgi:hypothetical protein